MIVFPIAGARDLAAAEQSAVRRARADFDRSGSGIAVRKAERHQCICRKVLYIRIIQHRAIMNFADRESTIRAFLLQHSFAAEIVFGLNNIRRVVFADADAVNVNGINFAIVPEMNVADDRIAIMRARAGPALVVADKIPLVVEFEKRAVPVLGQSLLKDRFDAAFWLDELDTYALALDGAKHPLRVVSSNAGHALFAGIAGLNRASRVGNTLLSSASNSGWGIRTIAADEARYNPMSYHNGSVWPHDNALIALGFARYGLKTPALRVLDGLFGAAQGFALKRLPELFCGFSRRGNAGPTAYPVACAPQAWSAASVFALLAAVLGISFVPDQQQIRFFRPALPTWLSEVSLTNLRLGEGSIDLILRRDGNAVASDVTRREGPIEIVVAY